MMTSAKAPTTAGRRAVGRVIGFLALCFGALLFIFPFYYMVMLSVRSIEDR